MDGMSVYQALPIPLQNLACTYYGWRESRIRYSRAFHERLQWLQRSEHWPRERIEAYENDQLRALIAHAYENVPFYRQIMQQRGLVPADIRSRTDLPKLPILTKEDVRKHADAIRSRKADHRVLRSYHTSGTTGKSLHFSTTDAARAFQWAIWWRHRSRFGLSLRDWSVAFSGRPAVPSRQTRPPYWRWERLDRRAYIPMQQVIPDKVPAIVCFLNSGRFAYYSGYPSIIHPLASIALQSGCALDRPPRVIALGAENLYDFQRRDIERFTGATLTDQYGFAEGCGNASRCPEGPYHEDFEYGIMECVDPELLADGRIRGRIVCTGFACLEFPFIRYEVGDVGIWEPDGYACSCGRDSRVLHSIEGRQDDYVLTPEGRRIMRFGFVFHHTERVAESQVLQYELGRIVIRVVRRPGYTASDEQFIRNEVARLVSPRLEVDFDYVDEIEREPNGKFRAVKSLLHEAGTPPEQEADPHP
jgi:phenylacetate-CoA ligase